MPLLDLTLDLGMHGGTTCVVHPFVTQPVGQLGGDVTRTVIAKQAWLMKDADIITARSL